jgi:23S rRNA pseudouridine1911/1915/1917 synthase
MSDRRWKVSDDEAGLALDKFLASAERLGSRSRATEARLRGKVFGSSRRRAGPFTAGPLKILYEDKHLIVLDKPAGLLAVPLERRSEEASIYDQIEDHLRSHGKRKPLVVHRIDRDTSGVVLFAKDARSQGALKQQFRNRTPERVYLAIVYGTPTPASGVWRDHLVWDAKALIQKETHAKDPRAAEAISHYQVLESFGSASLIEVRLKTGKRNQIRLQARLRGHTLVGERRYTYGPEDLRPIPFKRQALHAWRLGFVHPVDEKPLKLEAPLPADMKKLIVKLRAAMRTGD